MFFDQTAVLLNTLSLVTLAFFVGIVIASLILKRKTYWSSLIPSRKKHFLWLTVSMPWVVAVASPIFFGLSLDSFYPVVADLMHWHHSDVFVLSSWHIYPFILLLLLFSFTFIKSCIMAAKHVKNFRTLSSFCDSEGVLDVTEPNAFSAGLVNPRTFITKGLVNKLEPAELTVVRLHELSHVMHRDSLQKLIFGFAASFFPRKLSKLLQYELALSMELVADSFVASKGISRHDVAKTLLKVTKTISAYETNREERSFQCAFTGNEVKVRIEHLLTKQPTTTISKYTLVGSLFVTSLIGLLSVDTVHHIFETFFNH